MQKSLLLTPFAAAAFPGAALAQIVIDPERDVFRGDYVIAGVGVLAAPSYEGSDDTVIVPVFGATGEVKGVGFTIRGPSLSVDVLNLKVSENVVFQVSPQVRYRFNRTSHIRDEVVEKLGELDGVIEAGLRVGMAFDDVLSPYDRVSVGVSARWDISGKGSGRVANVNMTYRLPVSRSTAFGAIALTEIISDSYADYNFSVSPEGADASGLPVFQANGGFSSSMFGIGVAHDLSGDVLDGGVAIGAGVSYSRLYGSAAKTPITSIRGSSDQFVFGLGVGYIF